MTWTTNVLVVANVTAGSPELAAALTERAGRGPTTFTILVPSDLGAGGRPQAAERLATALTQLRAAGLEVDGQVADSDPFVAITEAWDPARYDEIVLCTLPMKVSKWLHAGLPERVSRQTGAPVTHVVAAPPRPPLRATAPPAHATAGVLTPLTPVSWGGHRDR